MKEVWLSINPVVQSVIICTVLTLLSCTCGAMVYRLVKFGVRVKAKVGAAEIDIDASEENEPEKKD